MPEPVFHRDDAVFTPTPHARGPWDPEAQHGGAPAALIVRAIEELGTGLALARLSIDFLGAVPLAPLTVRAGVARPGRRFAVAEVTLSAHGRDCCFARATLVRRAPVAVPGGAGGIPGRRLAGPEAGHASPFPGGDGALGFHTTAMDIRFVRGDYGIGPADVWFRLQVPLVDEQPASPLETLAAAADFGNGVSRELDFDGFLFVNLDLLVEVARAPRGEWIALSARTELGPEGTGVARSVLHDLDGPAGAASQTLFVAPR